MEEVLRTAVRVVMEPALRLIQGDAHQWSQRVPDKTDRTSIGLCATGRRQERREQDARARERPDDAGGLELLRLPLLPDRGVAEPLGDGLLLTSRPRPIHPAGAGDQTAHNTRIGP